MVSATPGGLSRSSPAQHGDGARDLRGELGRRLGHAGPHDRHLAVELRVLDPVVEAAPLERVVHLTGAVAGDHHDRGHLGVHGAELGHGHRVVREHLQQEGLELVVRAVDLVDQQHDGVVSSARAAAGPAGSGGCRPRLQPVGVASPSPGRRLGRSQVQQLPREVPVVQRLGGVDPS
jgi:hypothetical protein